MWSRLRLIFVVMGAILFALACSAGGGSGGQSNPDPVITPTPAPTYQASDIQIVRSSVIPVIDGSATTTNLVITNKSDHTINNISYSITSGNNNLIINLNSCSSIAAKSNCIMSITTPSLSLGSADSSVITASFNGFANSSLVSYVYVDSADYTGVNFSDNLVLYGANDATTAYVFVGAGVAKSGVSFVSNNSSVAVQALTSFPLGFATNQVQAVLVSSLSQITTQSASITPMVANQTNGQATQVTIFTNSQPHLVWANIPVLDTAAPSAVVTLINTSPYSATDILISLSSSQLTLSTNNVANSCSLTQQTLASGASCNIKIINTATSNGVGYISASYANATLNSQAVVNWTIDEKYPDITIAPQLSNVTINSNLQQESTVVPFSVVNSGDIDLTNVSYAVSGADSGLITASVVANTCGNTLLASDQCVVSVKLISKQVATTNSNLALKLSAKYLSNQSKEESYSTVSSLLNYSIIPVAISVLSTTPSNNQLNVSLSPVIVISFNTAMSPVSLTDASNFWLSDATNPNVPITLQVSSVSSDNQSVTLTLSGRYNQAMDVNSTSLSLARFATSDDLAPSVLIYPLNSSTNISLQPQITLSFSESVLNIIGNVKLYAESYPNTPIAMTLLSSGSNQYTWTPVSSLESYTNYQVVVESAIKDISGNHLSTTSSVFTTGNYVATTVTVTPANGSTNVAINAPILLQFSRAVSNVSTSTVIVAIKSGNSLTPVNGVLSLVESANNIYKFTPSSSFAVNTLVYYRITNGITDTNNNPIQALSGSFTTVSQPRFLIMGENSSSYSLIDGVIKPLSAAATDLTSILGNNAGGIIIAGNSGSILFSPDNAYSWTNQLSGISDNITALAKLGNMLVGVGDSGRIVISESSNYWASVTSSTTNNLNGISCTASYCIGVGDNSILRSTNAKLWTSVTIPANTYLNAVTCNSTICIAAGNYGVIYRSIDSGQSWESVNSATFNYLYAVYCDQNNCISVGGNGTVIYSVDAGLSWQKATQNITANYLTALYCDDSNCVAGGDNGVLIHSTDMGVTWSVVTSPTISNINAISYQGLQWIIVGNNRALYTSSDLSSWSWRLSESINYTAVNCTLTSCVAVSKEGKAYRSTSSGASWNSQQLTVEELLGVTCYNDNCMAVGTNGIIKRSTDGGISWSNVTSNTLENLNAVSGYANQYIAVGDNGIVINSIDSGSSFATVSPTLTPEYLYAAYCDNLSCMLGGSFGMLFGATQVDSAWSSITQTASNNQIQGISCFAEQCVAVTDFANIIYSADHGVTWSLINNISSSDNFNSVNCSSSQCLVVGNNGSMYYSPDAGINWMVLTKANGFNLRSVTNY